MRLSEKKKNGYEETFLIVYVQWLNYYRDILSEKIV